LFFFEKLEVDYVLFILVPNDQPIVPTTPTVTPLTNKTKKVDEEAKVNYEKDNKVVQGHLLNNMVNDLFDIFVEQKYAKEILDTLKYDAGRKKYVVGKWMEFQMVDDKPIMEHIHEYKNLVVDVLKEGMKMCDVMQDNVLLEKFPPS